MRRTPPAPRRAAPQRQLPTLADQAAAADTRRRRDTPPADACGAPAGQALLKRLLQEVRWEARTIRIIGRDVLQPRLVAYMADDTSKAYTYSGVQLTPTPWHPAVAEIRARLQELSGATFDSCLLNHYRDGKDNMVRNHLPHPELPAEPPLPGMDADTARAQPTPTLRPRASASGVAQRQRAAVRAAAHDRLRQLRRDARLCSAAQR